MLNAVSYSTFLKAAQVGYWCKDYELRKFRRKELKKTAMINPLSAIKPITGNLARTAMGSAKSILKDSWKGMTGFDKTLTVGLPLMTTLPTMFDKKDQLGRSRADRLTGLAGNITGGLIGQGLGNQLGKKIVNKLPGTTGKVLSTISSIGGSIGGSMLGESLGRAPFKPFRDSPDVPQLPNPAGPASQMS